MVLNAILGSLALLSLALTLWQWLAARRFPLHQRSALPMTPDVGQCVSPAPYPLNTLGRAGETHCPTLAPGLTLLKPLKGRDAFTEDCLRSWFVQQYPGTIQILFGIASADDPAGEVVRKLLHEFPAADARLVVCGPVTGANAKVSQLAQLERLAKHELLVISDADVRVPPDLLANLMPPLLEPLCPPTSQQADKGILECGGKQSATPLWLQQEVGPAQPKRRRRSALPAHSIAPGEASRAQACGLVCCFYRLANAATLAMQWEAIAINADFWSQVLQARALKPIDFALGAVMAMPRGQLEAIGGFQALANYLADDYQLGNRLARRGYSIALCPVVVECWSAPMNWTAVGQHQLRWARTIRVCQPVPYFFSILSNATLWPLLWLVANPAGPVFAFAGFALLLRILTALNLQQRLSPNPTPAGRATVTHAWLVPVKDLLQAAVWLLAFLGNRIEWRGQQLRLRRDGTVERRKSAG